LLHPFTAAGVVEAFLHNVYKLHGRPIAIISDRDKNLSESFLASTLQASWCHIANEFCLPSLDRWANREGKSMPRDILEMFCAFLPQAMVKIGALS
jgi:hypothetical protein